jgi:hypothetical protein
MYRSIYPLQDKRPALFHDSNFSRRVKPRHLVYLSGVDDGSVDGPGSYDTLEYLPSDPLISSHVDRRLSNSRHYYSDQSVAVIPGPTSCIDDYHFGTRAARNPRVLANPGPTFMDDYYVGRRADREPRVCRWRPVDHELEAVIDRRVPVHPANPESLESVAVHPDYRPQSRYHVEERFHSHVPANNDSSLESVAFRSTHPQYLKSVRTHFNHSHVLANNDSSLESVARRPVHKNSQTCINHSHFPANNDSSLESVAHHGLRFHPVPGNQDQFSGPVPAVSIDHSSHAHSSISGNSSHDGRGTYVPVKGHPGYYYNPGALSENTDHTLVEFSQVTIY